MSTTVRERSITGIPVGSCACGAQNYVTGVRVYEKYGKAYVQLECAGDGVGSHVINAPADLLHDHEVTP